MWTKISDADNNEREILAILRNAVCQTQQETTVALTRKARLEGFQDAMEVMKLTRRIKCLEDFIARSQGRREG